MQAYITHFSYFQRKQLITTCAFLLIFYAATTGHAQDTVEVSNDGLLGWYTDMQIASDGYPVIATYDNTLGVVHVIDCGDSACSDSQRSVSILSAGVDAGRSIKLLVNASDEIVVLYRDNAAGNLLLTACGTDCSTNNQTIIIAGQGGNAGWHVNAALNGSQVHVVYRDDTGAQANWSVQHRLCDLNTLICGPAQTIATVSSAGGFPAIALDDTGHPVIAYRDGATNTVNYTRCTATDCSSQAPISITNSANHAEGYFNNAYMGNGQITIASYGVRDGVAQDVIRVFTCEANACTNPGSQTISTDAAGLFLDVTHDANGNPLLGFYDLTNDRPALLTCTQPDCSDLPTPTPVAANQRGYFTAIGVNGTQTLLAFSNYAQGDDLLLYNSALSGDLPPLVQSTTPVDGTRNATTTQTISVQFSEAVDLAADALKLACDDSTTASSSTANGVTSSSLTISATAGTTCTATVQASAVTDTNSNLMPRDYRFSFTVADGAAPQASVPATIGTHDRVTVSFDQPVNLHGDGAGKRCHGHE
jgi:methionine-rich copper-binding protein CopC